MAWIVNYEDENTGAQYSQAYARLKMAKLNVVKSSDSALFVAVDIFASKAAMKSGKHPVSEKAIYLDAGGIESLPPSFDAACKMLYPKRELFGALTILSDDL